MADLRYLPFPALLLVSLWLMDPTAAGEIYKWVDENGTTHFSEYPPLEPQTEVEAIVIEPSNPPDWDPSEYHYSILNQARRTEERLAAVREASEEPERTPEPIRRGLPPEEDAYDNRYPVIHYPPVYAQPFLGHGILPRRHHPIPHRPPKKKPAHRFDHGDRFAHPARSHRRLGADKRFGYLGHRVTHRRSRREEW